MEEMWKEELRVLKLRMSELTVPLILEMGLCKGKFFKKNS